MIRKNLTGKSDSCDPPDIASAKHDERKVMYRVTSAFRRASWSLAFGNSNESRDKNPQIDMTLIDQ